MSLAHAPTPGRAWRFTPRPHPNATRNACIVALWRGRFGSYAAIARKIGCTRNAVAGVLGRARALGHVE